MTKHPQILATSKNKHLKMVETILDDNIYYFGQLDHENRPHGFGFSIATDGKIKQGEFSNGEFDKTKTYLQINYGRNY